MINYRKHHEGCSEEEVMRHVLKHSVPASTPGTPGWHNSNLQDLLCMCDARKSLPHLLVTLTMDEVSNLKWQPVKDLETQLRQFCDSFSFRVSRLYSLQEFPWASAVGSLIAPVAPPASCAPPALPPCRTPPSSAPGCSTCAWSAS